LVNASLKIANYISQGSVATQLRCGGISLTASFLEVYAESHDEVVLKIGEH